MLPVILKLYSTDQIESDSKVRFTKLLYGEYFFITSIKRNINCHYTERLIDTKTKKKNREKEKVKLHYLIFTLKPLKTDR